jgi:hypothetical protein
MTNDLVASLIPVTRSEKPTQKSSLGQERNVTRVFKDDVSGGIDERDFLGKDVDMFHRPEVRPSPRFRVGV